MSFALELGFFTYVGHNVGMMLSPTRLGVWTRNLLLAAGASDTNALATADVFLRATLRGMGHHDISYLPQRLGWVMSGKVDGRAVPELLSDSGAIRVFDGHGGLGESLCRAITLEAAELAQHFGVGMATVRNSNHFLAASPYMEILTEKGLMGIIWSNTDPCMSGPGGNTLVIGNNPVGFGAPAQGTGVNLDMCLAYASLGTLRAMGEKPVPPHWGLDKTGAEAKKAGEILDGGVSRPIGGHKGYSLALMHELLTAGLSGGAWGASAQPLSGGVGTHSQTILAIRLPFGANDFAARVESLRMLQEERDPRLRLPGKASGAKREKFLEEGLDIPEAVVRSLQEWSKKLGLGEDWFT